MFTSSGMSPRAFLERAPEAVIAAVARFWVDVGRGVRDGRIAQRWDVAELARRAGVSRSVAYEVEAGRSRSLEAAIRLCTALGLRIEGQLVDPRKRRNQLPRPADPLANARKRRWIGLEAAISGARPRYRGYWDAAAKIAAEGGGG